MQQITPCRWCNDQAEEAARFSTSIFTNATIGAITHDGEGSPRPKGSVLTVRFQLDGQEFLALNGGPHFPFTDAVSFIVHCETQEALDRMWEQLSEGGAAGQCGWLKDHYGLSWQIVPTVLPTMLSDPNAARAERVLQAVMRMQKLDINALEEAFGPR
jgi:predicted 3-demethylubiquinone-9 3-methyltransferase (glyoxalase superfamily)